MSTNMSPIPDTKGFAYRFFGVGLVSAWAVGTASTLGFFAIFIMGIFAPPLSILIAALGVMALSFVALAAGLFLLDASFNPSFVTNRSLDEVAKSITHSLKKEHQLECLQGRDSSKMVKNLQRIIKEELTYALLPNFSALTPEEKELKLLDARTYLRSANEDNSLSKRITNVLLEQLKHKKAYETKEMLDNNDSQTTIILRALIQAAIVGDSTPKDNKEITASEDNLMQNNQTIAPAQQSPAAYSKKYLKEKEEITEPFVYL
ncbi:MAG: hypothetical protein ACK4M7_08075 [Burkholderiales bacterium]